MEKGSEMMAGSFSDGSNRESEERPGDNDVMDTQDDNEVDHYDDNDSLGERSPQLLQYSGHTV